MRSRKSRLTLAVLAAALVASVAAIAVAVSSSDSSEEAKNVVETAVAADDFDTLVSLVGKARLADTLAGDGPFTVFAPTDAAFAEVPKATLDALGADPAQLKAVLLYHVAEGSLGASEVVKRSSIETLNGARAEVRVERGTVRIEEAKVAKANVDASNGVIHVIDRVLLPPAPDDA